MLTCCASVFFAQFVNRVHANTEFAYFWKGKPSYYPQSEKTDYDKAIELSALDSWNNLGWRTYYDVAMSENWFDGGDKFKAVFESDFVDLVRNVSFKNGRIQ